jgi:hypothetical protein
LRKAGSTWLARALAQGLLVGGRDVLVQPRERFEERTLVDLGHQLAIDLRQHPLEHTARRHPAERLALAQQRQFLVDTLRVGCHARQHLLDLFALVHRAGLQQAREAALETPERAQAHAAKTDEGLEAQPVFVLVDEDVERGAVPCRQAGALEATRLRQGAAAGRITCGHRLRRDVFEAVAPAVVAEEGGPLGVGLHHRVPARFEQGMQAARLRRVDLVGGPRRQQRAQRQAARGQQSDQGQGGHRHSSAVVIGWQGRNLAPRQGPRHPMLDVPLNRPRHPGC